MPMHRRTIQRFAVGILAAAGLGLGLWALGAHYIQWKTDPTAWPNLTALFTDTGRHLAVPAFATLGLLIVWLTPYQSGALLGVLFLSVYALWGVAGEHLDHTGRWFVPSILILDILFHTSAVRFSQSFPRLLLPSEVLALGTRPVTKPIASLLAWGLDPRVFWPVALLGEGLALGLPWG